MRNILKTILLDLAEKYKSLKLLNVEYSKTIGSDIRKPFDVIYAVNILRQEGVDFEPIIQDAIRDQQDSIIDEVREWAGIRDEESFPNLNFCIETSTAATFAKCTPSISSGSSSSSNNNRPVALAPSTPKEPSTGNNEEVIPVEVSVVGLPEEEKVNTNELILETRDSLKRVLLELETRYKSLKVLGVDYRPRSRRGMLAIEEEEGRALGRNALRGGKTEEVEIFSIGASEKEHTLSRTLQRNVYTMNYDITIRHQEGVDFGKIIVDATRRSHDSIIDDLRQWTGYQVIDDDFEFNLCILSKNGEGYVICSSDEKESNRPLSDQGIFEPFDSNVEVNGFIIPLWLIIVIAICSLLTLCCVCGFIFRCCSRKQRQPKKSVVNNNFHMKRKPMAKKPMTRKPTRSLYESNSFDYYSDSSESTKRPTKKRSKRKTPMPPPHSQRRILPIQDYPHNRQQQHLPAIQNMPMPPPNSQRRVLPIQNYPHNQQQQQQYMPAIQNSTYNPERGLLLYDQQQYVVPTMQNHYHHQQYILAEEDEASKIPDPSVGEIDACTYEDFDSIVKPDPSMYSLFPDGNNTSKNKLNQREPPDYTRKSSKGKDPILCIENGSGVDAPGFTDGDSHYNRDGPLMYRDSEGEDDGGAMDSFYYSPSVYDGSTESFSYDEPGMYHQGQSTITDKKSTKSLKKKKKKTQKTAKTNSTRKNALQTSTRSQMMPNRSMTTRENFQDEEYSQSQVDHFQENSQTSFETQSFNDQMVIRDREFY